MSISINNLLSQFRVQLPILTTLPETVPAGAEFYYNGTKWRGLGAGETGLPEGTPWPVRGYAIRRAYGNIDAVQETATLIVEQDELPNIPPLQWDDEGVSAGLFIDGNINPQYNIDCFGGCFFGQSETTGSYVISVRGSTPVFFARGVLGTDANPFNLTIHFYPPQP
jgi:hypothetical protein